MPCSTGIIVILHADFLYLLFYIHGLCYSTSHLLFLRVMRSGPKKMQTVTGKKALFMDCWNEINHIYLDYIFSVVCDTAGENVNAVVTCPASYLIQAITFASYGTPTGSCGSFVIGGCHSSTSVSVVSPLCIGLQTCSVPASNSEFGDPCSGTSKQLYIQVNCVGELTYDIIIPLSLTNN